MAIEAAKILITISTDAKRAENDISQLEKTTAKTDQSAKGMTKSFSLFKSLGIAAAAIGAVRAITRLGRAGIQAAAEFERLTVEFSVLNGSMAVAEGLMDDLREFSAMTPLSVDALANSAKQLQSFGTDLEDVIDEINVLGNVSLGNEEKLGRLTLAFGKIQARGKASMEEINQLLEAGVPILDQLATQFGTTEAAIFEMVSAGEIGFNDIKTALTDLQGEGGMFEDGMERLAETFDGKVSTALDNFKNLGATVFEGVLDDLGNGISAVGEFANAITRSIQEARDLKAALSGDDLQTLELTQLEENRLRVIEEIAELEDRLANDRNRNAASLETQLEAAQQRLVRTEAQIRLSQRLADIEADSAAARAALQEQQAAENRYNELWARRITLVSDFESALSDINRQEEQNKITAAEAQAATNDLYSLTIENIRGVVDELNDLADRSPEDDLIPVNDRSELIGFLQRLVQEINGVGDATIEMDEIAEESFDKFVGLTAKRLEIERAAKEESLCLAQEEAAAKIAADEEAAERKKALDEQRRQIVSNTFDLIGAMIDRNVEDERTAAIAKKSLSIAEAGINIAQGITAALATANVPLATAIGVAGAIQIGTIIATPIPGAQMGGQFIVPPGNDNDSGLLRVNSGEKVSVTPTRGSQGNDTTTVVLEINGRELGRAVTAAFDNGQAQIRRPAAIRTR